MPEVASAAAASESAALKAEGNRLFVSGHFAEAVRAYTAALGLLEESEDSPASDMATLLTNRALCNLKLDNYGLVVSDASRAIQLNPDAAKAYFRRGEAFMALGKIEQALPDFRASAQLAPRDAVSRSRLQQCRTQVREAKIREAIKCEDLRPLSETLDWRGIPLPADFVGPAWGDDEPISLRFVHEMIDHFKEQKNLARRHAYRIILETIAFLKTQPTLLELEVGGEAKLAASAGDGQQSEEGKEAADAGKQPHFTVCGDVHGQFFDVLNIFDKGGFPSETNPYLFNGDYVDRGSFGLECVLLFFGLKLALPKHFWFTRGNHETKSLNNEFGFRSEAIDKLGEARAFDLLSEAFNWIPLAALLGGKVLVVHGGLFSQDGVTLDDIRKINRVRQPPDAGIMAELLWSDPKPTPGRSPSDRGIAVQFGPDVTRRFLQENGLKLVVRSHQVKEGGYSVEHGGLLCTVFSAPNYMGQMGNLGAYVRFGPDLEPQFTTFEAAPQPNVPPMKYASQRLRYFS